MPQTSTPVHATTARQSDALEDLAFRGWEIDGLNHVGSSLAGIRLRRDHERCVVRPDGTRVVWLHPDGYLHAMHMLRLGMMDFD